MLMVTRLRWLGLVGTALMAASAFLAGRPEHRGAVWLLGVALWLAGTGALVTAWWRLRVVDDRRWLLVTGALWALPLLAAPPLGSHDVYSYACQGELVAGGLDPYRYGPAALPCRWLPSVAGLWRSTPAPYGPLWLLVGRLTVAVGHGSLPVTVTALRLVGIAGMLLATWAGIRLARRCGGDPAQVLWLVAISPLTLVHVVSGAHNDALLAGLVVAALLAATTPRLSARHLALAGCALGLAVAVKATAVVAAPFLLAAAAGRTSWRPAVRAGTVLTATAGATFAVLTAACGYGLGFLHAWSVPASMVQWLSVPSGVGMAAGYALRVAGYPDLFDTAVATARVAGLGALAVLLVALLRWSQRRPSAAAVSAAGTGMLATALLGPVFYAWYAIGGLAVLATTRLSVPARRVATATAAGLIFLTLPDSLGLATKTKLPGALLDVLLVAWVVSRQIRRHRHPKTSAGWLDTEAAAQDLRLGQGDQPLRRHAEPTQLRRGQPPNGGIALTGAGRTGLTTRQGHHRARR